MSRITTITYSRTVNLGNYESEKLEVALELEEGQDPNIEAERLRTWTLEKLGVEDVSKDQLPLMSTYKSPKAKS